MYKIFNAYFLLIVDRYSVEFDYFIEIKVVKMLYKMQKIFSYYKCISLNIFRKI